MYTAIVLLPLFGAAVAGMLGRFIGDRASELLTSILVILSAVLSVVAFYEVGIGGAPVTVELFTWIRSGSLDVTWSVRVDALTAVMLVVVTWVSAVVHVYSIGYMAHDPNRARFFSYLSLFTFAMLVLVTADDFVQMFFGWEGVGLCSYLLIGFWNKRPSANAAAIKAFLVNRVGDFGFILGILGIFAVFGSVDFDTVFQAAPDKAGETFQFLSWNLDILTVITMLLFVGAMGKSAQIGLHTWLPDAMEGPTPVSALIHAATMVTAGVFMVARASPLFEYAPITLIVVTFVGAATAFMAATIGMVQNDIKRVIAYSTCSQLGYMFFAAGVSAYPLAIFHLFTHAFFKALLFLGSGSVIHAMSDEQDMRKMGGIWRKVKVTYALMWIGSLALAGVPLFAGYYSKDLIIESAFASATGMGEFAFYLGVAVALMTAFYSWRLIIMTFHGEPRASLEVMRHVHESPSVMILPLLVLAFGSIFGGILFVNLFTGNGLAFWGNSILILAEHPAVEALETVPSWAKLLPVGLAAVGILLAWYMYTVRTDLPGALARMFGGLYRFLLNKWYFDELYEAALVRPAKRLGRALWKGGDGRIIDGFGPDGVAGTVVVFAQRASRLQSGYVYHYAFAMLIGVTALVTFYLYVFGGLGHE